MRKEKQSGLFFSRTEPERTRMNSFMSWVGGKKALRDQIVSRLCHSCDRYVEVFGGGGDEEQFQMLDAALAKF